MKTFETKSNAIEVQPVIMLSLRDNHSVQKQTADVTPDKQLLAFLSWSWRLITPLFSTLHSDMNTALKIDSRKRRTDRRKFANAVSIVLLCLVSGCHDFPKLPNGLIYFDQGGFAGGKISKRNESGAVFEIYPTVGSEWYCVDYEVLGDRIVGVIEKQQRSKVGAYEQKWFSFCSKTLKPIEFSQRSNYDNHIEAIRQEMRQNGR